MSEIHQFVPNFFGGDAISNQAAELQKIFISLGFKSQIFAVAADRKLKKQASFYKKYREFSGPGNLVFYHLSDPSEMTGFFKSLPDRKIIIYHNITPQKYFVTSGLFYPSNREEKIKELVPFVEFAFGASEFNRRELENFGFKKTGVLPNIFNPEKYQLAPDPKITKKYSDGKINLLFVGRIAPNKKIEDLLKIFYFYKTYLEPQSRLIIVGKIFKLFLPYYHQLVQLENELGLKEVVFTGHVSQRELVSYYSAAAALVSASEHEGFGVPLLEAMHFQKPVIAYAAAAVPETTGSAGVLFQEKNPPHIAELIYKIIGDKEFREKIISAQSEQVKKFYPEKIRQIISAWLKRSSEATEVAEVE